VTPFVPKQYEAAFRWGARLFKNQLVLEAIQRFVRRINGVGQGEFAVYRGYARFSFLLFRGIELLSGQRVRDQVLFARLIKNTRT